MLDALPVHPSPFLGLGTGPAYAGLHTLRLVHIVGFRCFTSHIIDCALIAILDEVSP